MMFYFFVLALLTLVYEIKKAEPPTIPTSIEINKQIEKDFPNPKKVKHKKRYISDKQMYSFLSRINK